MERIIVVDCPGEDVEDSHILANAVIQALHGHAQHCRRRGGNAAADYYDGIAQRVQMAAPAISVYLAMQVSDALRDYAHILAFEGHPKLRDGWLNMADRVDRRALNRPFKGD